MVLKRNLTENRNLNEKVIYSKNFKIEEIEYATLFKANNGNLNQNFYMVKRNQAEGKFQHIRFIFHTYMKKNLRRNKSWVQRSGETPFREAITRVPAYSVQLLWQKTDF